MGKKQVNKNLKKYIRSTKFLTHKKIIRYKFVLIERIK